MSNLISLTNYWIIIMSGSVGWLDGLICVRLFISNVCLINLLIAWLSNLIFMKSFSFITGNINLLEKKHTKWKWEIYSYIIEQRDKKLYWSVIGIGIGIDLKTWSTTTTTTMTTNKLPLSKTLKIPQYKQFKTSFTLYLVHIVTRLLVFLSFFLSHFRAIITVSRSWFKLLSF